MESIDTFGLVGRTIAEKYVVEAVADAGGTAVVYRAYHQVWKRPVALKVFRTPSGIGEADRAALFDRFVQEGALLAELSERSTAVIQARDIATFTTPSGEWVPYMVLEWLEGETLERLLEREGEAGAAPRSLDEAMRLLDPIAEALGLAHRRGIVHRDVKPSNLFAVREAHGNGNTLKLLDFGIAKVVEDARDVASFRHTRSGELSAFTPAYGAPEQFSRAIGPTGPWTDVFALALVLLELVTRRAPLEGQTLEELGRASTRISIRPSFGRIGKAQSTEVEAVFARAVTVEPSRRYASVEAFWSDLRAASAVARTAQASVHRPLDETQPAPTESAPVVGDAPVKNGASRSWSSRSRGARAAIVVGGVGVLVGVAGVMGVGGTWLVRSRSQGAPLASSTAPVVSAAPVAPAASAAPSRPACPATMVMVPASTFFMGSDEREADERERPAHRVTLDGYCIDRTEVTAEAFAACAAEGSCTGEWSQNDWPDITKADRAAFDPLCNANELTRRGTHPANCVSWSQASQFCAAAGARLPTEAEWELAARGTDGRRYPWGDAEPTASRLNACGLECAAWGQKRGVSLGKMYAEDDGWPATAPVGAFPAGASPYGALDMTGNVWEWAADRHGPYDAAEVHAPAGPASGDDRVLRGGAWNGAEGAWVRPTYRFHAAPSMRSHGIGFRCAIKAGG